MEEMHSETIAVNSACPHCGQDDHHCCHGHWHRGGRFFIIRLILLLAILGVTFVVGLKLGEFRGEFVGQNFGIRRGHMQMRGPVMPGYGGYRGSTMRFAPQDQEFQRPAPVQPAIPVQ